MALVLLILVAVALGVLQTGWGKREITSLASGALSGEGKTAEIAGIEGCLPFDVRVDRVRLGDAEAIGHLVPLARWGSRAAAFRIDGHARTNRKMGTPPGVVSPFTGLLYAASPSHPSMRH